MRIVHDIDDEMQCCAALHGSLISVSLINEEEQIHIQGDPKYGSCWTRRQTVISEVRPNPGNEDGQQCSICGAVLVCLSCGNHRAKATAEHLKALARKYVYAPEREQQEFLERALDTIAARMEAERG